MEEASIAETNSFLLLSSAVVATAGAQLPLCGSLDKEGNGFTNGIILHALHSCLCLCLKET